MRRVFGEAVWVVEFQITKHFVSRDVMEALAVLADSLQNGVGADDVGLDKRPGIAQGVVVVAFGGKCTTMSFSATNLSINSASQMSPSTKLIWSATGCKLAVLPA